MQDFETKQFFGAKHPTPVLSESEIKEMISNPDRMLMMSMQTQKTLPSRLHEAMLLFSFDPNHRDTVRFYLEWCATCKSIAEVENQINKTNRWLNVFFSLTFFILISSWISILFARMM